MSINFSHNRPLDPFSLFVAMSLCVDGFVCPLRVTFKRNGMKTSGHKGISKIAKLRTNNFFQIFYWIKPPGTFIACETASSGSQVNGDR